MGGGLPMTRGLSFVSEPAHLEWRNGLTSAKLKAHKRGSAKQSVAICWTSRVAGRGAFSIVERSSCSHGGVSAAFHQPLRDYRR